MRIGLVSDTFLPEVNGVTTVLAVMRDGLRARGHEVLVLAPRSPGPASDEPGVVRSRAVPCPGYPQVRLAWPWGRGLARALSAFRPDLLHVVTEGPLGLFGRCWARRRRIPLVTSFHTDFPRYLARYLGRFIEGPTRAYLRWFHQAALATQTPSEVVAAELRALGLERVEVWGRGVDTRRFRPARRTRGRTGGEPVLLLHVGRLAVEKDVATLVGAFRAARARLGDRVDFVVAGDGPRAAWVRAALPFARHLGFLDRDRLADLYADADLFVFPSPTETCGLVVLEAMASGVPVIAADRGGVQDNLRHGLNGLVVRAGDAEGFAAAIAALVEDASRRRAMGEAARAFAVGRDWSLELDRLEAFYRRLIPAPRAAAAPRTWPTTTSVT